MSRGFKSTALDELGPAMARPIVMFLLFLCNPLRADAPIAVDDRAETTQNTPVSVPVLTNDWDAESNQLAIIQVAARAHRKIVVNSGGSALPTELTHLFGFAAVQLSNTVVQVGNTNRYPRGTEHSDGSWNTRTAANWISGFYPGVLWYMNEQTGDAWFSDWARNWMGEIAPLAAQTSSSNMGFMVNNRLGNGHRLTGDPQFKAVATRAASSTSGRAQKQISININ